MLNTLEKPSSVTVGGPGLRLLVSSRVPVVTMSDIDDYSRRNNNPKRRMNRKRKPGVKESKRKSIVANQRPRVGGRFVKNPKKITSNI